MQVFCWKQQLPLLDPNFAGIPLSLECRLWGEDRSVIIFEVAQLIWPLYLNITDGLTDGWLTAMHIEHEWQNSKTSQIQSATSPVDPYLWCLMVFTIRLGQGLGSCNVSVSSRTLNVSSRTKCPTSRSQTYVFRVSSWSRPERSRAHRCYKHLKILFDLSFKTGSGPTNWRSAVITLI